MGIGNKLRSELKKRFPEAFKEINLSDFKNKKIAIDITSYLFRCITVSNFNNSLISKITYFFKELEKNNIKPIIVFEGPAPPEKKNEQNKRREKREESCKKIDLMCQELEDFKKSQDESPSTLVKNLYQKNNWSTIDISLVDKDLVVTVVENEIAKLKKNMTPLTSQDIKDVEQKCQEFNFPYIFPDFEGEHVCAWLCRKGYVDCAFSEDSDLIALQCPKIIFKSNQPRYILLDFEELCKQAKLTSNQMVDLCILCGTDYNPSIEKYGFVKSFQLISTEKSITDYVLKNNKYLDWLQILNYQRVRKIFECSDLDTNEKLQNFVKLL
jgi:5'-3' exonuclease